MAVRMELVADDPNYIWWYGEGTKDQNNPGIFSIGNTGDAYFGGDLAAGVIYSSSSCSSFGIVDPQSQPIHVWTTTTSAGNVKRIIGSINYTNSGTNASIISGTPSVRLVLERGTGSNPSTWTQLMDDTIIGSVLQQWNGSTYLTTISLAGSFTFTDQIGAGTYTYRVTGYDKGGPWPHLLNGNIGRQRLSVSSNES